MSVNESKRSSSGENLAVESNSIAGSHASVHWTAEEEARVVRKVDWHLLPGLTFLYLLSFLDRANIGNAKLLGMLGDLGITEPSDYNTALALYFLGYVLFEIPAQAALKRLNPKKWLPVLTVAWGVTATLQGLITNRPGFFAARFFLGVSEAGLFPGCVFVFSQYYKRRERHWRVAIFFAGAALAGSLGGILAYGIGHINGGGLAPWAWIFVIEGIFTVLVGISAFYWVPGYVEEAKFLNERERSIVVGRLQNDIDGGDNEPFNWGGVAAAFKDPFVWGYGWLFHAFAFTLYSLSLFIPTIIAQLGYTAAAAQLLTIPIYAAAFVFIVAWAYFAHLTQRRGVWIIAGGGVALVGYVVLLATSTSGARLAGAFLAVIGIYASNGLLLAWPAENVSPSTKRAVASGMQIFIGDIGAIAGVLIYRPSYSDNFYRKAHIIAIGYTVFGIAVAATLTFTMRRKNQRNARYRAEHNAPVEEKPTDRLVVAKTLGDRAPTYTFQE